MSGSVPTTQSIVTNAMTYVMKAAPPGAPIPPEYADVIATNKALIASVEGIDHKKGNALPTTFYQDFNTVISAWCAVLGRDPNVVKCDPIKVMATIQQVALSQMAAVLVKGDAKNPTALKKLERKLLEGYVGYLRSLH